MKHACTCKDCEKERLNKEKHFNNPFYKEVDDFVEETKEQQILKGAQKYPEPFDPDSWSIEELAVHGMQELRDAQVYITGMRDRMRKQEKRIIDALTIVNSLMHIQFDYKVAKEIAYLQSVLIGEKTNGKS